MEWMWIIDCYRYLWGVAGDDCETHSEISKWKKWNHAEGIAEENKAFAISRLKHLQSMKHQHERYRIQTQFASVVRCTRLGREREACPNWTCAWKNKGQAHSWLQKGITHLRAPLISQTPAISCLFRSPPCLLPFLSLPSLSCCYCQQRMCRLPTGPEGISHIITSDPAV